MSVLLIVIATCGVIGFTLAVATLAVRLAGLRLLTTVIPGLASAAVTVIAIALHLTTVALVFAAPVTALGGLFGVIVSLPRSDAAPRIRAILAALLTVLVYLPITSVVFSLDYDPFATGIGFIDLGWALPALVGGTAAAVGAARFGPRVQPSLALRWWPALWPALLAWAAGVAWLIGIALTVDRNTVTIATNVLLMPVVSALVWALVERARHRTNTPAGVALGLLAGCAAAAPAAGNIIPLLGGLVAAIAGGVAALAPSRGRAAGAMRVPITMFLACGVSVLLLGLLGRDVSFIYTGQPEVLFTQLLSLLAAAVLGFVLGAAAWVAAMKLSGSRRS